MKKKFTMLFAALLAFAGVAKAQVTLPDANKVYTVVAEGHNSGAKPGWAINNEGTKMVSFGNTAIADDAQKEFAFVQNEGKVYLYSVWAEKFVNKDMSLTDALPIDDIKVENVDGGKYYFKYDDSHNMNIGGSKQLAPDGWSTKDGGNQYTLTIVKNELDLTKALAILNNSVTITYEYVYNGDVKLSETIETTPGADYPNYNVTLPFGVTAEAKPEGKVSTNETKQINLNVSLPFAYAENYEAIEANQSWNYLMFHATQKNYLYYDGTEKVLDASKTAFDKNNKDAYSWAFVGNPFDGFKVVNRLAGAGKRLNASKDGAVVSTADHTFVLTSSTHATDGFFMASTNGESTQRFNKQGGKVVYWSGADAGSTFMVEIRPMGPVAELEALIGEAETLETTVKGNIGTAIGEYTQATANALTAAIAAAKAIDDADVTADDVATLQAAMDAVKVILPTAGQYYQIHSSLTKFATEQGEGVVKAVYSNNGTPSWKTLNGDDKSFYWLAVDAGNGNVVFQNAADKKYLVGNAGQSGAWTMADAPTAASNISVKIFSKEDNQKGYEYGVIMNNWQMHCAGHGEGKNASGTIVSWNTDAANSASSWYIVETELEQFYEVVYNFVYDDEVKYSTTISVKEGAAYPEVVVPALPYGVATDGEVVTPEGIVTAAESFNFELTIESKLPFVTAADANSIDTWYYARMHTNQPGYIGDIADDKTINVDWGKSSDVYNDNYVWGFVGNVFDGITVVNRGTGLQLTSTGNGDATLTNEGTPFFVARTTETNANATYGFCLRKKDSNNYLNANYSAGKLSHWSSTDAGSTIFLTKYEEAEISISSVNWATMYLGYSVYIPEGVNAYTVASTEGGYATLNQLEGVIPANTGVLLENEGEYTFQKAAKDLNAIADNLLRGSVENSYVEGLAYVLANGEKGVGLYIAKLNKDAEGNEGDTHFLNNAGKAYLVLPAVAEDEEAPAMFTLGRGGEDEDATGIDQLINANGEVVIYDLAGRRVEKMEKGIYIVNGKKVVIK